MISLATESPEYRAAARERLGKHGAVVFQEHGAANTIKRVGGEHKKGAEKELPTQETDPTGADRAVLDWFLIGSVDVLLMSKSSFSCSAAWRGMGQGTLREVWNYQAAPGGGEAECALDYDADAEAGARGSSRDRGLNFIDESNCAA